MYSKSLFFSFVFFVISCNSTKHSSNAETTSSTDTSTNMNTMDEQKLMADGFLKGIIVHSEMEGDCPYTIKLESDPEEYYYLDPINLEERFKKDGEQVWIKFHGLRRMNRCNKANPVEILEIKKGG